MTGWNRPSRHSSALASSVCAFPLATDSAGLDDDDGSEWIGALLPRLAADFDLLACLPADASDALIDAAGSGCRGILGGIEIAAAPGKTARRSNSPPTSRASAS